MDANYLKTLTDNQNKIKDDQIFQLLIHSIKGTYRCEEERKIFSLSRSVGNVFDLEKSYVKANDFIKCYNGLLDKSKTICKDKYNDTLACISKNRKNLFTFPKECVPQMEDFINC